jgi:hypothetical protein
MASKVQAIDAHGWSRYKAGCRCAECKKAAAERIKQSRANAKKRKQDEAAALAAAEAAEAEARAQQDADDYAAYLYTLRQEERAREAEWEVQARVWAEQEAMDAQLAKEPRA